MENTGIEKDSTITKRIDDLLLDNKAPFTVPKGAKIYPIPGLQYNLNFLRDAGYIVKRNSNDADYILYNPYILTEITDHLIEYKLNHNYNWVSGVGHRQYNSTNYISSRKYGVDHFLKIVELINEPLSRFISILDLNNSVRNKVINNTQEFKEFIQPYYDKDHVLFKMLCSSLDLNNNKNKFYLSFFKSIHENYFSYETDNYFKQIFNKLFYDKNEILYFYDEQSFFLKYDKLEEKYNYIDHDLIISYVKDKFKEYILNFPFKKGLEVKIDVKVNLEKLLKNE